jgi:hypothetical protein
MSDLRTDGASGGGPDVNLTRATLPPLASSLAGTTATTPWGFAADETIDASAYYLVKTNAGEWRDPDLRVMKGYEVQRKLEPDYVRGRPILIARVLDPGPVQNR